MTKKTHIHITYAIAMLCAAYLYVPATVVEAVTITNIVESSAYSGGQRGIDGEDGHDGADGRDGLDGNDGGSASVHIQTVMDGDVMVDRYTSKREQEGKAIASEASSVQAGTATVYIEQVANAALDTAPHTAFGQDMLRLQDVLSSQEFRYSSLFGGLTSFQLMLILYAI